MKNKFIEVILILLGFILMIFYIWINYLRERLPRDIPYTPTIIIVILLLVICSIYIFSIKHILKPSKVPIMQKIPQNILHWIIKKYIYIYTPINRVDIFIKKALKHNIQIIFLTFFVKIFDNFYNYLHKLFLLIMVLLIPRLFLITLLSFDIFCFSKINIFYNFIIFAIIPLIVRYILYLLRYCKENLILYLESIYNQVMFIKIRDEKYHNDNNFWLYYTENSYYVEIREFIEIQTNARCWNDISLRHTPFPKGFIYEQYLKDHPELEGKNLTKKHYDSLRTEFYKIMPLIIPINVFFNDYDNILKNKNDYKYILLSINIMYLICWSYVLFFTLKTLPIEDIIWITSIIPEDFDVTNYKEIINIDENK